MFNEKKSVFYQQSAFRYWEFVGATAMVLLDACLFGVLLFRRWNSLPAEAIESLIVGILALFLLWRLVFVRQKLMYRLLRDRKIDKLEPGSGLDAALYVASDMAMGGLFFASISVAVLLHVAFELSRAH